IAAVLVVGGAAYLAHRNMQPLEKPQTAGTTNTPVAGTTATPATPATPTRPVRAQDSGTSDQKPAPASLTVKTLNIDTTKDLAEACLTFSAQLLTDAKYQDYVKVEPETKLAIRVAGDRLCLGGLVYGQDYKVELKAGFPAAGDLKLANAEPITVSLGERPPLVTFGSSGLVLPRESTMGVPITTLNVAKVMVRVYRVSDRLLARLTRDQLQNSELYLYQLKQLANEDGTLVWHGEMSTVKKTNEKVTTAFPLRDVVKPWVPGVYFIAAWNAAQGDPDQQTDEESPGYYDFRANGQWVIDSDTGLTTFQGSDGMHVFARSLQTAQPMAGVTLTLIAKNNEELSRATTDAQGRASFAPGLFRGTGGNMPVAVMSYGTEKKDFNYLDLQRGAFDLSDRGVDGRATPGPMDAYLYTDRGIYRPGETVNVVAMLRDRTVNAVSDVPLTLVVKRPDGVEANRHTLVGQNAGVVTLPVQLSPSSRRGMWSVAAYIDPKGSPVGQVQFSVEDFVPQRLKVTLESPQKLLHPGDEVTVNVESRFLYGAPAADLAGEASIKLSVDPNPFPQFAGFRFGLIDDKFKEVEIPLQIENTDDAGKTVATGKLIDPDNGTTGRDDNDPNSRTKATRPSGLTDTSLPLKANLTVAIFEPGGRNTSNSMTLPVRTKPVSIGLRPTFAGGTAPYQGEAPFEIIVVDDQGQRIARPGLDYTVVREEWNYNWYRSSEGRWRWETYYRDVPLANGTIDALAERPVTLRQAITWGRYRVELRDTKTGAATSYRFYAGWREQTSEAETPDTVTVTADKASYAIGDTAHIRIEAPFAGEALIALANDRIFDTRTVTVPAEGVTVDIPVSAEWGPGAYALVTAYRPLAQKTPERSPVRAIGVAWMAINQSPRTLAVQFGTPDRVLPRQKIEVPIKVTGQGAMKDVMVTLAAVDEGILQLTKFVSPAPDKYYFGKRRLTVAMRDDYGQLLDGSADGVGVLRTGGDSAAGGRGLEVVPVKIVSLFSGIVRLNSDGTAKIPLDIPDFTGELRLMAVAFDATRVGMGEGKLTVRDPVVSDMTFPRFLAPGDDGRASLLLHNVEGKPGNYKITLTATGAVSFTKPVEQSVDLPEGKRLLLNWPLHGSEIGIGTVALHIEGPGGFAVTRDWQIQVRPAQAEMSVEVSSTFAPNGELVVDKELLNQFVPGSADISVTVSRVGGIDVASLLRSLDRYPYGCLEQTTSRAFPLLFFTDLALLGKVADDKNIKTRLQNAISRILDMQGADGSFGMWSAGSYPAYDWLQVFALDFLMQARDQKYFVPDSAIKRGLSWMRNTVGQFTPDSAAYAYYVLARAGLADVGQLRYFQDTQLQKTYGPLARAQIGAALFLSGEKARANQAFASSRDFTARPASWTPYWEYYGTDLRDTAATVVFALQGGQQNLVPELVARIRRDQRLVGRYDTSTQEKTWLLMAAFELMKNGGPLKLTVDGKSESGLKDPAVFSPDPATVAKRFAIRNDSGGALWSTVAVRGIPKDILGPEDKGLTVKREFSTMDGKPVDLTKLKQNDRLLVSITGQSKNKDYHEVALV
ncbi:MAG: alpha-2-macroglobulin, partial [Rhodospirillales bacterium]